MSSLLLDLSRHAERIRSRAPLAFTEWGLLAKPKNGTRFAWSLEALVDEAGMLLIIKENLCRHPYPQLRMSSGQSGPVWRMLVGRRRPWTQLGGRWQA